MQTSIFCRAWRDNVPTVSVNSSTQTTSCRFLDPPACLIKPDWRTSAQSSSPTTSSMWVPGLAPLLLSSRLALSCTDSSWVFFVGAVLYSIYIFCIILSLFESMLLRQNNKCTNKRKQKKKEKWKNNLLGCCTWNKDIFQWYYYLFLICSKLK